MTQSPLPLACSPARGSFSHPIALHYNNILPLLLTNPLEILPTNHSFDTPPLLNCKW